MGLFVYAVASMSANDLQAFLMSPYGLIADVKMLDFFRKLGLTAAIVLAALIVLSVPIKNFWCRYLCPYGALLGLVALASLARWTGSCHTHLPEALLLDLIPRASEFTHP